jgi:hypothetical protein
MQKLIFIIFAFSALICRSQAPGRVVDFSHPPASNNQFYLNADLPVVMDKYPAFASGTPYFIDEWSNADIELANEEIYKNVKRCGLTLLKILYNISAPKGEN